MKKAKAYAEIRSGIVRARLDLKSAPYSTFNGVYFISTILGLRAYRHTVSRWFDHAASRA